MISRGTWMWLALVLAMGFGLFQLKYEVQGLEEELARTNRQILESEEAIHVLKAEWSYLNEPKRVETLARRYLGMQPLTGKQYGSIDDLPQRGSGAPDMPPRPGQARPAAPMAAQPPARPAAPVGGKITFAKDER
ncbi:MAG TPA: hypothetical protein VKY65_13985 [Alphaproteobacteria bacterium]|nr:hypothetical protein [Alphaproteobacteria bacterium]